MMSEHGAFVPFFQLQQVLLHYFDLSGQFEESLQDFTLRGSIVQFWNQWMHPRDEGGDLIADRPKFLN